MLDFVAGGRSHKVNIDFENDPGKKLVTYLLHDDASVL